MNKHIFHNHLHWQNNLASNYEAKKKYKNHQISTAGKTTLELSAAPAFKGDASLHNPEDLLLASISSCHMMSFLYVCQQNNIVVLNYEAEAEAILVTDQLGKGKITQVILQPKIRLKSLIPMTTFQELHDQAHELCFIANSVNIEIAIVPQLLF